MTYHLHSQHVDLELEMHVMEYRDDRGNVRLAQIALGLDSCPACGRPHIMDNLSAIDPKALQAEFNASINSKRSSMHEYAEKHGIPLK